MLLRGGERRVKMGYKVNPANLSAVFVVPSQIVDKHIRLASGQQLKVLLWVLRHANDGIDMDKLCKDLKFEYSDAVDYLQYWVETGILLSDDSVAISTQSLISVESTAKQSEPSAEKPAKSLPEITPSRPTPEEIATRAEESPDIKFLLRETQVMLGRTIGYDGQCTLIMMHDTYGIPVEVILMIIDYSVSVGKANFHYISSIGKDWGEREIDTIEKADEQIRKLTKANKLWASFAAMAGLSNSKPTQTQAKMLSVWNGEWNFSVDMIYLAYEEMTNNCRRLSFPYMNKVLESWHNDGIKTLNDVEAYKKGKRNSQPTQAKENKTVKNANSSYDLDEFQQKALHKPLVYNKKGK